jgi:hypothetical protein
MIHYCDYIRIGENNDALFEVCSECKKKLTTKKGRDGRIDSEAFRKAHLRDFAQPRGITANIFKKYYGKLKK